MERGDIYLVGLDPSTGHEPQGRRPVLIVSPGAFNRLTKVPVVLPITSGGAFARTAGFAVSLQGAGTQTVGVVRCDQPRALDIAARGGRRVERVPDAIMDEVRSQGQFSRSQRESGSVLALLHSIAMAAHPFTITPALLEAGTRQANPMTTAKSRSRSTRSCPERWPIVAPTLTVSKSVIG